MDETIQALEAAIADLEQELHHAERKDGTAVRPSTTSDLVRRIAEGDSLLARLHAGGVRFATVRPV